MHKPIQYDIDKTGPKTELFLYVYNLLKKNPHLHVQYKQNITSFFSDEGGVCYLRIKKDKLIIGLFKGSALKDYAHILKGEGKHMRHLIYTCKEDVDEKLLNELVEESMIINIERSELLKMRK